MKIEKGNPGYIKSRKTKYLIWALVEFAVVLAIFILGYVQTLDGRGGSGMSASRQDVG